MSLWRLASEQTPPHVGMSCHGGFASAFQGRSTELKNDFSLAAVAPLLLLLLVIPIQRFMPWLPSSEMLARARCREYVWLRMALQTMELGLGPCMFRLGQPRWQQAEGLLAALRALCMAVQKIGTSKIQVVIVLDCRSVIEVAHGKLGTTPVLACRLQRALGEALRCFHQVTLTWVPSHGKGRSGWRPHEGLFGRRASRLECCC